MPLINQDRVEETFLIIGDSWRGPNRIYYFIFTAVLLLIFPVYLVTKLTVYNIEAGAYEPPRLLGQAQQEPLEIVETGFVEVAGNSYSAFVKIKNNNLDWGVPKLTYHAEIIDISGTVVAVSDNINYVLPASEKIILLPRFSSDKAPEQINFSVNAAKFVLKPPNFPDIGMEIQRSQIFFQGSETVATAVIKNVSPFTISKVDLTASVYNERGELVAMNYTNINDLISGELRSFQLAWPSHIPGKLRVEIATEIDPYIKDILKTQSPVSPFNQ